MPSQLHNASLLPNTVELTEVVLARSIGVFSLLLVALAMPDLLQNTGGPPRPGYMAFVGLVPALVIAGMVAAKHDGLRRFFAGTVAWLVLLGFLLWHLGWIGNSLSPDARPWSWGIAGAGIGLAALAKNIKMASLYGLCFTLLVLFIPAMPAGSAREWSESWQDALLTAAMTAVIIAPIWALRQAVQEQELAAVSAAEQFSDAARSEAITVERMRLDALTHDIVLSTLIVASQAQTESVVEASRNAARQALSQLDVVKHDAGAAAGGMLAIPEWLGRLAAAVAIHGVSLTTPDTAPDVCGRVPLVVARAMTEAATEAVRNSLKHAEGAMPVVTVSFPEVGQVVVEVGDNGPGFDLEAVPLERLGLKISILERMRGVQGQATVVSHPGAGAVVRLEWEQEGEGLGVESQ